MLTQLMEYSYPADAAFGSGTQIGTGNFVVYNGSETSVNITALTSGTAYYFAIYEYNSASNCYLTPALTGNATTTITPFYCAAGSNKCDEYISNVTFGTINKTSDCSTGGYVDYSTISTDIAKGSSLVISITNGKTLYSTDQCGIWVDWNNNGDFTDDQAISVTGSPGIGPYSATIICPLDASPGLKRIRIRILYTGTPSPCDNTNYGEVEDYTINVIGCTPPAPPTVGTITQPTCDIATGSVDIK